jgi:hypothetical protein
MRSRRVCVCFGFLLMLLAAGFAGWRACWETRTLAVTETHLKVPSKAQIESDLRLEVLLNETSKTIQAGEGPWVTVALVNTSNSVTHRVVQSGHGSEVGYREPHLYWTATIDCGDGKEVPIPKRRVGYCGTCLMFASNWPKDAVLLKPGARLVLNSYPLLEFQRVGRVRLRAQYDYQGSRSSFQFTPEELGFMAGVPAHSLTSNSVEFDVTRPLDVQVKVKGALKAKRKTRLSDVLSVTLANRSKDAIELTSPTLHADARLCLELDAEFGWRPTLDMQRSVYGIKKMLRAGEEIPLLGDHEFANGLDGNWEYPQRETVKLRAGFMTTTWKNSPLIWSDWVEVQVVEE